MGVRATDDVGLTLTAQVAVAVANVAPTPTALAASPANGLVGQDITFTGSATDPSAADTAAGFRWAFDTGSGFGPVGANGFSTSYSSCGKYTVSAKGQDKDGGVSAPVTSAAVHVYAESLLPPLTPGVRR